MNSPLVWFVLGVNRCLIEGNSNKGASAPFAHGEISRTSKMLKFNRSFNFTFVASEAFIFEIIMYNGKGALIS